MLFRSSGESDDPEAVFSALTAYLADLRKNGLSTEDFHRYQHVLYADTVKNFDSVDTIANNLLDAVQDGADPFAYARALSLITFDEVTALFHSYFADTHLAMSVISKAEVEA